MIRNIKIDNIEFKKGRPLVCVPVSGSSIEEVIWEIEKVDGADLIEWRADFFREDVLSAIGKVKNACGERPLLLTYRTKNEGGKLDISDKYYFDEMKKFIFSKKVDIIDIEFSSPKCEELVAIAKKEGVVTIISSHDFEKTMAHDEIIAKLNSMEACGGDIPKIAQMPQCFEDVVNLISASHEVAKTNFPIITMSMGKLGKISRLCGEASGSAVSFGASKIATAPGQLKVQLLNEILDELSR